MRRKSTRTSGKLSPEKGKQSDSPVAKSRRTSRRRRKSTSESENSEDEQEVKCTTEREGTPNLRNPRCTSLDTETNNSINEKDLSDNKQEIMDKHDKKIKLKRNRSSGTNDGNDISNEDKHSSRRSRRRGSPKMEEKPHREDDGDDRKGKGKSKGKTKSTKIEKSQPPNESETHNESDISTNAQVTPQSPQIVNTNLMVDNEVDVAENAEENKSTETERTEDDPTGDTDNKVEKSNAHDELNNSTKENDVNEGQIETESQIKTEDITETAKTPELVETHNEKVVSCVNSSDSDETAVSAVETSDNVMDKSGVNEGEKSSENAQSELSQPEIDEPNIKTDDDFAGFTKNDQSFSKDTSQFSEEPMDISMDVTFTLKTEDSSINLTEAEETIDNNQIQSTSIECASSEENNRSKTPDQPPQKPTYSRKISVRRATSSTSETSREKGWGSSSIYFDLVTHVKIDTELIQNIYTNVQLLDESEVKLDIDAKDRRRSITEVKDRKRLERNISNESEGRKYDSQTDEKDAEEENANIIAMNRKISIVDDSASKLKPPPSPAKNPTSSVLFITNLVRPFTLKQLKELLERTGKIKENCFWTDRIKSKCYVQYENVEDAEATRNALHGVHWPIGNGKKLVIDYGTEEELENAKNPPATPPIPEPTPKIEKENQELIKKLQEEEEEKNREKLKEKRRHEHVREWDVGKTEPHRGRSRSRTRDKPEKRKHSRHSPSPFEDYLARKQKKAEDQVPQKMMDDLFQKTKTTPSIYWQPLSPEEIATKQQQRLERMAEHKRRLEESTRTRAEFGRGGPYRRRYD